MSVDQEGFAFGRDDGTESGHTLFTQDTNQTLPLDQNFTLRILLNATGDDPPIAYSLRYQKNGAGGYIAVPVGFTANSVYVASSANIPASGEPTSARLTPPTGKTTSDYHTGRRWDDENGTDTTDNSLDSYTELEWCLQVNSTVDTDFYDFRVYIGSTPIASYSLTPRFSTGTARTTVSGVSTSSVSLVGDNRTLTVLVWRQEWNGSVVDWFQTWAPYNPVFNIAASATATFTGFPTIPSSVSFAPAGALGFTGYTFGGAALRVPGSTTVLFEGTTKTQGTIFNIAATGAINWSSGQGSALIVTDDQTTMAPDAASIVNSVVVGSSSLNILWFGSDVNQFSSAGFTSTATLNFASAPIVAADLSVVDTAAVTFVAAPFYGADLNVLANAGGAPWSSTNVFTAGVPWVTGASLSFEPFSSGTTSFSIPAFARAEFSQAAGALSIGAYTFTSTSTFSPVIRTFASSSFNIQANLAVQFARVGGELLFGALDVTQPAFTQNYTGESTASGAFTIRNRATMRFASRDFEGEDDDLPPSMHDALRRELFQQAAYNEQIVADRARQKRINKIDESDMLVFAEALSNLVAMHRGSARTEWWKTRP